jgi:hypothetical protein
VEEVSGSSETSAHFYQRDVVAYGYQYMAADVISVVRNSNLATERFLLKDDAFTFSSKYNNIV